ncbi:MAG: PIN domain-containing protein [Myxococcota bacterium]
MSVECFVDTNVLIYAHDVDAGEKHRIASSLVRHLWETRSGAISAQVLHELCVNLQKKLARPLTPSAIEALLEDYCAWTVVPNDAAGALEAVRTQERYRISYWDALIIVAARRSGAETLYSEDLNDGQAYGGVTVSNPFARVG